MQTSPTNASETVQTEKLGTVPTTATQSVFFANPGIVKDYPINLTEPEIKFDYHTNVLGQTPQDYYGYTEPAKRIEDSLRLATKMPRLEEIDTAVKGMIKLAVTRPQDVFKKKSELSPEALAETYKSWGDLFITGSTEEIQKKRRAFIDKEMLKWADDPILKRMPNVPWILFEGGPGEALELVTTPSNYALFPAVGKALGTTIKAIEKYTPILVNRVLRNAPEGVRNLFLKDLFKSEMALKEDFATLGLTPNAKTADVFKAGRKLLAENAPDRGGDPETFIAISRARDNIMNTRNTMLNKLVDVFRTGKIMTPERIRPDISSQMGTADMFPWARPDMIVKSGENIGKIISVEGLRAVVDFGGKVKTGVPLDTLQPNDPAQLNLGRNIINKGTGAGGKIFSVGESQLWVETPSGRGIIIPKEELGKTWEVAPEMPKQVKSSATGREGLQDIPAGPKTDMAANQQEVNMHKLEAEANAFKPKDPQEVMKMTDDEVKQAFARTFPDEQPEGFDIDDMRRSLIQEARMNKKRSLYSVTDDGKISIQGNIISKEKYSKYKDIDYYEKAPKKEMIQVFNELFPQYDASKYNLRHIRASVIQELARAKDWDGSLKEAQDLELGKLFSLDIPTLRFSSEDIIKDPRMLEYLSDEEIHKLRMGESLDDAKGKFANIKPEDIIGNKGQSTLPEGKKEDIIPFVAPKIPKVKSGETFDLKSSWVTKEGKVIESKDETADGHEDMARNNKEALGISQKEYNEKTPVDQAIRDAIEAGNIRVMSSGTGNLALNGDFSTPEQLQNLYALIDKNQAGHKRVVVDDKLYNVLFDGTPKEVLAELKAQLVGGKLSDAVKQHVANEPDSGLEMEIADAERNLQRLADRRNETTYKRDKSVKMSVEDEIKKLKEEIKQKRGRLGNMGQTTMPEEPKPEDVAKLSALNLKNLSTTEQGSEAIKLVSQISDEIENMTGKKMTNKEVIEKMKSVDVLDRSIGREKTLKLAAQILKTRQQVVALAEKGEMTQEFLDAVERVADLGTDAGRIVQSFKIPALPAYMDIQEQVARDLMKLGMNAQEIVDAAKGVDFKNLQQVTEFYRKFVKPSFADQLNEFAYMNILSSPTTHIVNTVSNLSQLLGLNPLTRLATGAVDMVGSALTGKERTRYMSEVPAFYKGVVNAVPSAVQGLNNALSGKTLVERPDVKSLPTNAKWIDYTTLGLGKYVTRALEGADIFVRTLVYNGELEALMAREQGPLDDKAMLRIRNEAMERAKYYIFRGDVDPSNASGQGNVLSAIDGMTTAIYGLRKMVPGARWLVRFVQTPMNILKQGVEYSPAGFSTLVGAEDKQEQFGKAIIGSAVFAGAYALAMQGQTTWEAPKGKRERQLFDQAGRLPYSVKIGDQWVSFSKLGGLAYPLAMAAALHYYETESPRALSDSQLEKAGQAIQGIMGFFSDQSYVQGLGDITKTIQGDPAAVTRLMTTMPTQLIPLSSLQGWVNQIIDPLYRQPEKGFTVEAMTDNLKNKIIGLSQTIAPKTDMFGREVQKDKPLVNALSPVRIRTAEPTGEAMLQMQRQATQIRNQNKKQIEKMRKETQRAR